VSGVDPFVVANRVVNPLVGAVLRSPAHRLLSGRLMLLTVTGRRTGRALTFPVGYREDGDRLHVHVASPEQKRWWRNLRGGAPVAVELRRVRRTGFGRTHGNERDGVAVVIQLD
jgi:hypothetical protein